MELVVAIISIGVAIYFYIKKEDVKHQRDIFASEHLDLLYEIKGLRLENKQLKQKLNDKKKEVE